ncbi:hypothetical protein QBC38DRAFT_522031 [Podospora fimiseda]|uniref:Oligopeptide transporter n=1 Tax=Podospora fimiseda TaxID=252190 RepID=A0AAN7BFF5_9PEZI|nr:hypothetical protein QBC38DRAFT_522031 [Podospora fimiseda]
MSTADEKAELRSQANVDASGFDGEKIKLSNTGSSRLPDEISENGGTFNAADDDLLEATAIASTLTLEDARELLVAIREKHERDPNFEMGVINKIKEFLGNDDIFVNPDKHEQFIEEMKIQAALMTSNSPYAEVRAVVDNHDDPTMPVSTIRAWAIGIVFSTVLSVINIWFDVRQPPIGLGSSVSQLLAYPLGKFLERVLPDVGFTLFGIRHSLNPGPFNKKEHMLITIMSTVSGAAPYTNYIVWIQVLPQYFNQEWPNSVWYQLLIGISTNFIGYGMAGICRQFLVYPATCIWPASLVTISLNSAFHDPSADNTTVLGPLKSIWKISRMKYFGWVFLGSFIYFWLPNLLIPALSAFSWITWIAPGNVMLTAISGFNEGIGLNPIPTLDWNIISYGTDPLAIPFFSTLNFFLGAFIVGFIILGVYLSNAFYTAYLPLNSNHTFDRFGQPYNISRVVNEKGEFDGPKYEAYSAPFLSAANVVVYTVFFALYSATVAYGIIYHRFEIMLGFRTAWTQTKARVLRSWRRIRPVSVENDQSNSETAADKLDVHYRLMQAYAEVPEWWYMICLVIAVVVGMSAIAYYPTETSPAVVLYGIALCLLFVVPVGIIASMTGVEVTLNVLAEFIGGVAMEGNAVAMCFFKGYGYVTCAHAIGFSSDLKLAHYCKIPPRFTFWAQMLPTLVGTLISIGILQYQTKIQDICTKAAPYEFYCPGINTFFTAAVFWGTVGPRKIWGIGGRYAITLIGFPIGVVIVLLFWWLNRRFPKSRLLRNTHPVVMLAGGLNFAPYNLCYLWSAVPIGAFTWLYVRKRYLEFWGKYNYITTAGLGCGVAIAGLLIFFIQMVHPFDLHWWGTDIVAEGCDGNGTCRLLTLNEGEYMGPRLGEWH